MMKKKSFADISLSDEAIDRIVYLSSGHATEQDHAQFIHWRHQSPQHEMAAQEAEALWLGIGTAGKNLRRSEKRRHMTRRTVLGLGAFVAGGAALHQTGLIGPRFYADYTTGIGEQRTITLTDGSAVTLNAGSALSVHMTETERRLTLYEGQALFTVAKDHTRPFIVEAQNGLTRALGTIFDIDIKPEQVVVTVIEGTVGVIPARGQPQNTNNMVIVQENSRVQYAKTGSVSAPEYIDSDIETAWRRGKLIFNAKPLGDVVAELERYRSGNIILTSKQLYALQVTGVFDLSQPEEILQAIETTLPVSVIRLPFVTILHPNAALNNL